MAQTIEDTLEMSGQPPRFSKVASTGSPSSRILENLSVTVTVTREMLNAEKSPFQRTYATQAATKVLARQLVRLTQQIANLQGSRAQMRGIATHTQFVELVKSMDSVCCLLEPGKQLFIAAV
ncbi:vacuolar protein sorting-associated protein 2 homolog 2-like [Arachis duranensis]|uniref:Vacuolar protein sorting-associated protein 2 homolog 2-like n=1 Tax=Arachis duranensis TaxID=130453 RepID=A0A9C6U046_ARADU|nr:vacuolar protein sorting-associated protein 2 homolog 2-like [Arachis duranensis]